jgi:uncharacterized protein (DUF1697 family)
VKAGGRLPAATHVAFLRAVNVGGHVVPMDQVRAIFGAAGCKEVATFLASGNVVFDANGADPAALETKTAQRLEKAFGYPIDVMIRSGAELSAVAACAPFSKSDVEKAVACNIAFLAGVLSAASRKKLAAFDTDLDRFHGDGREVYWLCRVKQSDSSFKYPAFEKALAMRATWRGINTVRRLVAKHFAPPRVVK